MILLFSGFPLCYSVSVASSITNNLTLFGDGLCIAHATEHCFTSVILPFLWVVLDLRVRRIGIEMMPVIATVAGSVPHKGMS